MRVAIVQNSPVGGPGLLREYLDRRGWPSDVSPADDLVKIGPPQADLHVFLGSPHGVYEEHIPWIVAERDLVRDLHAEQRPMLGICFGAQMIGSALGASVQPVGRRFEGWMINDDSGDDVWRGPWFRWHGDAIDLPADVPVMARDQGIPQIFRAGNAIGIRRIRRYPPRRSKHGRPNHISRDRPARRWRAIGQARREARSIRDRAFAFFDRAFSEYVELAAVGADNGLRRPHHGAGWRRDPDARHPVQQGGAAIGAFGRARLPVNCVRRENP